jgi:endonuclease-3 related protein
MQNFNSMNYPHLLIQIFDRLLTAYGPQSWWPADTPFEMMVGAILTQNTAWTSAEKAISNLKTEISLTPEEIGGMDPDRLQEAVRPSGYFRQKAERLHVLSRFVLDRYDGKLSEVRKVSTGNLREQLLSLKGIGPETADSILLYALERPVFVIDAYTVRLFSRLGFCGEKVKYDGAQALFMDNLEPDTTLFNEYHALIVVHSKRTCSKRAPRCGDCSLYDMCAWESKTQGPKSKKGS